ncbi:MAG: Hsp70 family protein [Ruminococcus sp.]|nr:Hsp70 family protein [Ruminococcus sp.]
MSDKIFGIDLGTTYSCIAKLNDEGTPVVIENFEDQTDTLASAVFFESEDNIIVGDNAKASVEEAGDRVVEYIKRHIGKNDGWSREFFGVEYTPIDISAMILKRLRQMVQSQGDEVDRAVITCPAYFGIAEQEATRRAGELAGLEVVDIIQEPTAAALCYCARKFKEEKMIMVYDLGGGTFDVTVLKMWLDTNADGEEVQHAVVLCSDGSDMLGGKDWDDVLYQKLEGVLCEENGIEPSDLEPEDRQAIRSQIEKTKRKLSRADSCDVRIPYNGSITRITVTREEFESLTSALVDKTMSFVENVIGRLNGQEVDTVLLVGGSTMMPMIQRAVEARFPGKVQQEDPHRAVAKGAAIYASLLMAKDDAPASAEGEAEAADGEAAPKPAGRGGVPGKDVIRPQLPSSFGVGVLNGKGDYIVDNLIKMGTYYDEADAAETYRVPEDGLSHIVLRVFEDRLTDDEVRPCVDAYGDEQDYDPSTGVRLLGDMRVDLPDGTPKGTKIEVNISVTTNGIKLIARNLSTGEEVPAEIDFKIGEGGAAANVLGKISGE